MSLDSVADDFAVAVPSTGLDSEHGEGQPSPPSNQVYSPKVWSLAVFIAWHCFVTCVTILAIVFLALTGNTVLSLFICALSLLTGALCTHAAWVCRMTALRCRCLPLQSQGWPLRTLLVLPLGLFQGIIIVLACDELGARKQRARDATSSAAPDHSLWEQPAGKRFNYKAVMSIFEGLLSAAIMMFAYWGTGIPEGNEVTPRPDVNDKKATYLMKIVFLILFLSGGLGLQELDRSVSSRIALRLERSWAYEILHMFYRTLEGIARGSVLTAFTVLTFHTPFFFTLMLGDFLIVMFLILHYGGSEVTPIVRLLCGIPCMFANVFRFVDSPTKRSAAQKITWWLNARMFVETLLVPLLLSFTPGLGQPCVHLFKVHTGTSIISIFAIVLFWPLHFLTSSPAQKDRAEGIFQACEHLDVETVQDMTTKFLVTTDINCYDVNGRTPLMVAVSFARPSDALVCAEICRLLIRDGSRLDAPLLCRPWPFLQWREARPSWTVLHIAAWRGLADVLRVLLLGVDAEEAGGDPRFLHDSAQDTPLHVAVRSGCLEAAQVLIRSRPSWAQARNGKELTPLDLAQSAEMKMVLDGNLDFDTRSCSRVSRVNSVLGSSLDLGKSLLDLDVSAGELEHRPQGEIEVTFESRPAPSEQPTLVRQTTTQLWPQVVLRITRSGVTELDAAPGLCSYVASTAGGPLVKYFCRATDIPSVAPVSFPLLSSESGSRPAPCATHGETVAEGCPHCQRWVYAMDQSLNSSQGSPESADAGRPSEASLEQTLERTPERALAPQRKRRKPPTPTPKVIDLEPVDDEGEVSNLWRGQMQQAKKQGRSKAVGYLFANPPEEASLGRGAYGVVWKARCSKTGATYAVKNIRSQPHIGASSVANRECQVADKVRLQPHPCLIHLFLIHQFAEVGVFMLVQELGAGGNILSKIRAARRTAKGAGQAYSPPASAMRWACQIFLGLEHLHLKMQTLLRDLKPDNVVLDDDGRAKLTDFGFGHFGAESPGEWTFGCPPGSPGYISPEILRQEPHRSAADLYSYGVLLWVLLTGGVVYDPRPRPPYPASRQSSRHFSDFQLHREDWRLMKEAIDRPEQHGARRLPEDASRLIAALTQRRPELRPSHAEIRCEEIMRPLRMPSVQAEREEVLAWLDET